MAASERTVRAERAERTERVERTEWTDELEKQLKYLGECAQGYVRMYKMDILRYSKLQQRWTSGNISAGVIGGALLTLALSLGLDQSQAMIIISAFLSFGSSVCQGYLYQVDYASILADLKRQAAKYSGLQNNIKRQLSMPRRKREKAEDYHYWITNNYDQLGETSLNIHPDTVDAYRKICEKDGLPFPDENAADARIVIHIDPANGGGNESTIPRVEAHKEVREDRGERKDNGPQSPRGHVRENTNVSDVLAPEDKSVLTKGGTLRGQVNIQEALGYTDQHMRYELARLAGHDE